MSYSLGRTIILAFLFSAISSLEAEYFWREYTGKIPEDAIIAGRNLNGDNVYIGQAYVKNEGLFPAQITAGAKQVYVAIKGAKLVNDYIKILCGFQDNFLWLPTNSTSLHLDLLNKKPVIGGHEDGLGKVFIGRISYEGGAQIGKVNGFTVGNAWFRWVDKHKKEPGTTSYEVLVYQEKSGLIV